jgi:hypothetical protein
MAERLFPAHPDARLLPDASAAVPWDLLLERTWRVLRNHDGTPAGLAGRGGLSRCELVASSRTGFGARCRHARPTSASAA